MGAEWIAHAGHSIRVLETFMTSDFVFDTLLLSWLTFLRGSDEPNEDEGLKLFDQCARSKLSDY